MDQSLGSRQTLLRLKKDKRKGTALIPVSRFQIADAVRAVTPKLRTDVPELEIPEDFPRTTPDTHGPPGTSARRFRCRSLRRSWDIKTRRSSSGFSKEYRANTSLIAEYESRAISSAGMLRPSAAALLSAEPSLEESTERGDELAADSAQGTRSALIQTEG